jgi:hypothetical protein
MLKEGRNSICHQPQIQTALLGTRGPLNLERQTTKPAVTLRRILNPQRVPTTKLEQSDTPGLPVHHRKHVTRLRPDPRRTQRTAITRTRVHPPLTVMARIVDRRLTQHSEPLRVLRPRVKPRPVRPPIVALRKIKTLTQFRLHLPHPPHTTRRATPTTQTQS